MNADQTYAISDSVGDGVGDGVAFPRNHVVFTEGEPGDRLYIIRSGKVKLCHTAPDGREFVLAVLGPGDMFGGLSVFDPGPRASTATTLTRVSVVSLGRLDLQRQITDRPEIAEQLLRVLARQLRRTHTMWADLITKDVPSRIAKVLLQFAHRFGSQEGAMLRVTHDLTQEEIGQLVGTTREMANKTLADFARRGWLRLEHKGVLIVRPERLAGRVR